MCIRDRIRIDSPSEMYAVVLHPHIEVKTADARAVLQPMISLKSAITQWGNVGGLIAGLYTSDYELIGRSLEDVIVEPLRKHLIPVSYTHLDVYKRQQYLRKKQCQYSCYRPRCFRKKYLCGYQ